MFTSVYVCVCTFGLLFHSKKRTENDTIRQMLPNAYIFIAIHVFFSCFFPFQNEHFMILSKFSTDFYLAQTNGNDLEWNVDVIFLLYFFCCVVSFFVFISAFLRFICRISPFGPFDISVRTKLANGISYVIFFSRME